MSIGERIVWGFAYFLAGFAGIVALNVLYQLLAPKDPRKPPVVFHYVPIIGCAVSYGMDPYGFMFRCREKYGNVFTFPLIGKTVTVTLGPLGNNFVLNGKLAHVNAEMAYTNLTTPVFGTEVVYDCPNSMFLEQKKFVKFGLGTEQFKKYVPIIVGEVERYFQQKVFKGKESTSVDAFTVSSQITVCTATATLQGKEVRQGMDESFADLYHDLDGGFIPINFAIPGLPLPQNRRRDVAQRKMAEFYISIMKARRASDEEPADDMLTALQNQSYKNGEPLTDKQIAHIMIALLMAGQHTSAATGSWIMLHLGERPDLQEALWKEQLEYHGDGQGGLKPLTYETVSTPLVSAVIKEILRLHPPIHSLMRGVISDVNVPTTVGAPSSNPSLSPSKRKQLEGVEYVIPKGHYVLAAPGVSMVDEQIWGQDSYKFDETRWTGDKAKQHASEEDEGEEEDYGWGKISKGGKSAYLPFGAGRHRCIGEQFANVQLGTIVATLVRLASWKLDQPLPSQDYTTMIVMPKQPRNVTFTARKATATSSS